MIVVIQFGSIFFSVQGEVWAEWLMRFYVREKFNTNHTATVNPNSEGGLANWDKHDLVGLTSNEDDFTYILFLVTLLLKPPYDKNCNASTFKWSNWVVKFDFFQKLIVIVAKSTQFSYVIFFSQSFLCKKNLVKMDPKKVFIGAGFKSPPPIDVNQSF